MASVCPTDLNAREIAQNSLSFIPSFLGEESLYSWAARFHLLSGNVRPAKSSEELFHDKRTGLRVDFPSRISIFCESTQELLGSSLSILQQRTLFGFFAPFLTPMVRETVLNQMMGHAEGTVKRSLGLLASRVGAIHPLKVCRKCMREDIKRYGVATWKMEHQWPSVWICRGHNSYLYAADARFHWKDPRKWILPDELSEKDWHGVTLKPKYIAKLFHIAEISVGVAKRFPNGMDPERIKATYLYALQRKGLIATDGSIKFLRLRDLFLDFYRGLSKVPGFGLIANADASHGGLLGLLTRQYQGQRHPLKHLLLISYLFTSAEEFEYEYGEVGNNDASLEGKLNWRTQLNQEWKIRLQDLVETNRLSVSVASKQLGIPLPQAIRFAHKAGMQFVKKPRVLSPELRMKLSALAREGFSYQEIVETLQVKKSFVRSFMAQNKELRKQWHQARRERIKMLQG